MLNVKKIGFSSTQSNIAFSGHRLSENDKGEKVYRFYIPKVYYKNATLLLKKISIDANGNFIENPASNIEPIKIPQNSSYVEINPKNIGLSSKEALAYAFEIDGQSFEDKHRNIIIKSKKYNIADTPDCDVLQTPNTMYHLMPGIFNPKLKNKTFKNILGEKITSDDATAQMNHFMKFNTSIDDIIAKIPHIKRMGFRRILSTPIFGQDNISNAGYWTANPFQITKRYGTMRDFEKLQIELFKNSMGFVADGAFTAEGLSGIHFQDVLRNGTNSPFYRWFEAKDDLKLGVLSDIQKVYNNLELRVINSPIIWNTDKDGLPANNFGKRNPNYNPQKETSIQLFDKRLTSKEQLEREEPFISYDIKNTQNKDDIKTWMDSAYPYVFPVNPNELSYKAHKALQNRNVPAKEFLLKWNNFSLTTAKKSAGLALWTGSRDMVKLRFVLPEYRKREVYEDFAYTSDANKEIALLENATKEVQNYVASIGKFWTNKTAKTLRMYIAKELTGTNNAHGFQRMMLAKAGKQLPEEVKYFTTKQIQFALDDNYEASDKLYIPKTINKLLQEYPLEALEVQSGITSIFAHPSFKKKAQKSLYSGIMQERTLHILSKFDSKNLPCKDILEDGDIATGQEKMAQLLSDDIIRFLLIKGLDSSISANDIIENNSSLLEKLKNISSLKLCSNSRVIEQQEDELLQTLKRNISKISDSELDKFTNYLVKKFGNITPESIKVADLIIDKTEAGLNWRIDAAKDIADMEAFGEGNANISETWGEVANFWKKFNDGVRLYNNHSYKIAEFTDSDISNTETSPRFYNAGQLESKIVEQKGFTTQTNYSYLFDSIQRLVASPAEVNAKSNTNALDLIFTKFIKGWNGVPGYLYSGNKNNITYSHAAVGNHDKQRITQTYAMNTTLAYLNEIEFLNKHRSDNYWREIATQILTDLESANLFYLPIYEDILSGNWREIFNYISPANLSKVAAYSEAFDKATKDIPNSSPLRKSFQEALGNLASRGKDKENNFFYKNFENTFDDIVCFVRPNFKDDIENLKEKFHKELTAPAITRGLETAKLMVALPDNPTWFAGDELLEFGGEEKLKNVSVQNRNRLHWENVEYPHVSSYIKELSKIYNLRNDSKLSSLVNGDTVLLNKQGGKDGREVLGLYRYNEDNDCIILIHNIGYNSSRHYDGKRKISIPKVDLSHGHVSYHPDDNPQSFENVETGLPKSTRLKTDTTYVDAFDSSKQYVIKSDGNLYDKNNNTIELNSIVTILKRA